MEVRAQLLNYSVEKYVQGMYVHIGSWAPSQMLLTPDHDFFHGLCGRCIITYEWWLTA